jgi:hypothetical protein
MAAATKNVIPKFRYLSAWFCPFAHRATLALEHHKGRVDYEWVEVKRICLHGRLHMLWCTLNGALCSFLFAFALIGSCKSVIIVHTWIRLHMLKSSCITSHIFFVSFGIWYKQGWEQRPDEKNVTGAGHEWWYHWKAEELKRACPGM